MSDHVSGTSSFVSADPIPTASAMDSVPPAATPLMSRLSGPGPLLEHGGVLSAARLSEETAEWGALTRGAALHDLGWLRRIAVRGEDRVRWLNGMLTNTIQGLAANEGNYNFLLNAQGRIQGDAFAYRFADEIVIETTAGQAGKLTEHLDRFIIMDDVELLPDAAATFTTIGISGPEAPTLLRRLGADAVFASGESGAGIAVTSLSLAGQPVRMVRSYSVLVPRFAIWATQEQLPALWSGLVAAGAVPAGVEALERLRVAEGSPLYGVDIGDRDLPQEANQPRALNFSKGCYLGQEIVERIRSRATVHRQFGQFLLSGEVPPLPAELHANGQRAGVLTSAAVFGKTVYGLGMARVDAREREQPLDYSAGSATALSAPDVSALRIHTAQHA